MIKIFLNKKKIFKDNKLNNIINYKMDSTNNETVIDVNASPEQQVGTDTPTNPNPTPTPTPTDGFTPANTKKSKTTGAKIPFNKFKEMLSGEKFIYYDKYGRATELDNDGVFGRKYETIKEKDTTKYKFTVSMKTYLSLVGDVIVMEWLDGEVKYYTKLNHPDLKNWSGRMYWKGV
jgi:hypothetical protein